VHGPEARPGHQAVPPDRARQGGVLPAVRQLTARRPLVEGGICICFFTLRKRRMDIFVTAGDEAEGLILGLLSRVTPPPPLPQGATVRKPRSRS